jgi:hypothetical protein
MSKRNIVHTYKIHESMNDYLCFYCGFYGNSKDHVPPVSYPDEFEEESRFLVRSCLLCNSLLANKMALTFLSRCDYLVIRYEKRFKKCLEMPEWSFEEINQLSGRLKRTVVLGMKKKKSIEEKLLYLRNKVISLQGYD